MEAGTDVIRPELIKQRGSELLNRMDEPGGQIWGRKELSHSAYANGMSE